MSLNRIPYHCYYLLFLGMSLVHCNQFLVIVEFFLTVFMNTEDDFNLVTEEMTAEPSSKIQETYIECE